MHREIVAWGFRIGGLLLGLPALAGLVLIGASFLAAPPADGKSQYLDVGKYGIAGLLANGAKGMSDALGWLGGIAQWLEGALAVVLGMAFALAVVVFLTGRGIARHAAGSGAWGIALSVVFGLFWLVLLLSTSRSAMAVPAVGLAMSSYAVWVLGWR